MRLCDARADYGYGILAAMMQRDKIPQFAGRVAMARSIDALREQLARHIEDLASAECPHLAAQLGVIDNDLRRVSEIHLDPPQIRDRDETTVE